MPQPHTTRWQAPLPMAGLMTTPTKCGDNGHTIITSTIIHDNRHCGTDAILLKRCSRCLRTFFGFVSYFLEMFFMNSLNGLTASYYDWEKLCPHHDVAINFHISRHSYTTTFCSWNLNAFRLSIQSFCPLQMTELSSTKSFFTRQFVNTSIIPRTRELQRNIILLSGFFRELDEKLQCRGGDSMAKNLMVYLLYSCLEYMLIILYPVSNTKFVINVYISVGKKLSYIS